jgi:hypothetical protein
MVAVTSDRGLCGGLNSNIAKYTRAMLSLYQSGAQLARWLPLGSSFAGMNCRMPTHHVCLNVWRICRGEAGPDFGDHRRQGQVAA